ncbi:hypothetical protein Rhopal_001022-T1 [Rhodotorula paludigena]|uniref:Uncharacterized protein n=1 Tax=Rhodotorula paludigena TaxID=86838 RepID=A0AAV5G678_9BASI|nr:hypothetical protein Rhopal_001022-T1 [Rhodotorula paludigena]
MGGFFAWNETWLGYGLAVSLFSYIRAVQAWLAIKDVLDTFDLVRLRYSGPMIEVPTTIQQFLWRHLMSSARQPVERGVFVTVPAEVWLRIRNELVTQALGEAERNICQRLMRHSEFCKVGKPQQPYDGCEDVMSFAHLEGRTFCPCYKDRDCEAFALQYGLCQKHLFGPIPWANYLGEKAQENLFASAESGIFLHLPSRMDDVTIGSAMGNWEEPKVSACFAWDAALPPNPDAVFMRMVKTWQLEPRSFLKGVMGVALDGSPPVDRELTDDEAERRGVKPGWMLYTSAQSARH